MERGGAVGRSPGEAHGNPERVNMALGDLIRPLPGQRQAGEDVDNSPGHRDLGPSREPVPLLKRQSGAGLGAGRMTACGAPGEMAWGPSGGVTKGQGLLRSRRPKAGHRGPSPLPGKAFLPNHQFFYRADNWESPTEALDEETPLPSLQQMSLGSSTSVTGSSSPLGAVFSGSGHSRLGGPPEATRSRPPCRSLTPTPLVLSQGQRHQQQRHTLGTVEAPLPRGSGAQSPLLSFRPHHHSGRGNGTRSPIL